MGIAYFATMEKFRSYAVLVALLLFLAYFGVYGFYATLADSIGDVWALAGAGVIALGALIVGAVGIAMIQSRPPRMDRVPEE